MSGIKNFLKLKRSDNPLLSLEDIPDFLEIMAHYLKEDNMVQSLIKENLLIMIELEEGRLPFFLKITEGIIDYGSGNMESANIIIITNLKTLSDLIFGRIEALIAVFSEKIRYIGDLYKMLSFLEIFYSCLEVSHILGKDQRSPPIEIGEMKELLDVYHIGSSIGEPYHLSSFLKMISLFANYSSIGQEYISEKEMIIYLHIIQVADFQLTISNNKFKWEFKKPEKFTLKIESNLSNFIDIVINGDPVTSFMAGNLNLQGNNAIPDSIFFQKLIGKYLKFLGLGDY